MLSDLSFAPLMGPDYYFVGDPRYFRVVYTINGHMDDGMRAWRINPVVIRSGVRQLWQQGVREIENHQGQVIRIPADRRCPDQIFAADPLLAFINEDGIKTALVSRMKYAERQAEVSPARSAARQAGFQTIESDCVREGSGDTLFDPNYGLWFVGVGKRTNRGAGQQLEKISGRPVIELPTLDDHFYHIDTFMSFLPHGHVMLYRDAMTPLSYALICKLYPAEKRLEMDRRAAMTFAANPQIITEYMTTGDRRHTVVMPEDCPPKILGQLRAWGYNVETIDIKAARRAGGGIHCCFQRVWDLRKYPLQLLPEDLFQRPEKKAGGFIPERGYLAWGTAPRSSILVT